jgi:hypothetical protein
MVELGSLLLLLPCYRRPLLQTSDYLLTDVRAQFAQLT